MDNFFKLFEGTNVPELNKQIECYAQENLMKEIHRSDPAVVCRDGIDYLCVTSTFETDSEAVRIANHNHTMENIKRIKAKLAAKEKSNA